MRSRSSARLLAAAAAALASVLLVQRALGDPPRRTALGPGRDRVATPAGTFEVTRDGRGRRVALVHPSGVVDRVDRDAAGRVARITSTRPRPDGRPGAPHLDVACVRDGEGRAAVVRRDGVDTLVEHDGEGRVALVAGPWGRRTAVRLDAAGRRAAVERQGALEPFAWSRDGRLVAAGDLRLAHDARGRVVAIDGPPGDVAPTWTLRLGWAGERLASAERREPRRRVAPPLPPTLPRGEDALVVERLAGDRTREWLCLREERAPVAYREDGAWTHLHADAAGSVLAYTDARGAVVSTAAFSPWGEVEAPAGGRPLVWRGGRVVAELGLALVDGRPWHTALGAFLDGPGHAESTGVDEPAAPARGLVDRLTAR